MCVELDRFYDGAMCGVVNVGSVHHHCERTFPVQYRYYRLWIYSSSANFKKEIRDKNCVSIEMNNIMINDDAIG